ncbi:MAG: type II toxin-antitoxin system HicA family toxin [Candidatus Adiutrix sp.]|jgi:hypothetical protein|nr:type II toxin-antitoxin system HicA family toxin [Candidatus Adiutrix sp.]
MIRKEKLIERFLARPADFTFDELISLLRHLGYTQAARGHTGGSRVAFINDDGDYLRLHKPHPRNILKRYQVEDLLAALKERGLL